MTTGSSSSKLDVLGEHCDRRGTDYDAIEKTILHHGNAVDEMDAFLKDMERFAGLGVSPVGQTPTFFRDPVPWATRLVEDVVPRLEQI